LDGFAELKICVGYKLNSKIIKRHPSGAAVHTDPLNS